MPRATEQRYGEQFSDKKKTLTTSPTSFKVPISRIVVLLPPKRWEHADAGSRRAGITGWRRGGGRAGVVLRHKATTDCLRWYKPRPSTRPPARAPASTQVTTKISNNDTPQRHLPVRARHAANTTQGSDHTVSAEREKATMTATTTANDKHYDDESNNKRSNSSLPPSSLLQQDGEDYLQQSLADG